MGDLYLRRRSGVGRGDGRGEGGGQLVLKKKLLVKLLVVMTDQSVAVLCDADAYHGVVLWDQPSLVVGVKATAFGAFDTHNPFFPVRPSVVRVKNAPFETMWRYFYLDKNREGMVCVCVCVLDFVFFPPLCTKYGVFFFVARCGRCGLLAGLSLLDGVPFIVCLALAACGSRYNCAVADAAAVFSAQCRLLCMLKKKTQQRNAAQRNATKCIATQNETSHCTRAVWGALCHETAGGFEFLGDVYSSYSSHGEFWKCCTYQASRLMIPRCLSAGEVFFCLARPPAPLNKKRDSGPKVDFCWRWRTAVHVQRLLEARPTVDNGVALTTVEAEFHRLPPLHVFPHRFLFGRCSSCTRRALCVQYYQRYVLLLSTLW